MWGTVAVAQKTCSLVVLAYKPRRIESNKGGADNHTTVHFKSKKKGLKVVFVYLTALPFLAIS
jgi:hypothetical protein